MRRQNPKKPLPATTTPGGSPAATGSSTDCPPPSGQHPAFGAMKGLLAAAPDVDLTVPADPEWGGP